MRGLFHVFGKLGNERCGLSWCIVTEDGPGGDRQVDTDTIIQVSPPSPDRDR
jgi:hypothetical protein